MKKNKAILISAILFSTYIIYIAARTIYYLINYKSYGNVYFEFNTFYPHLIIILIKNILNYILFFKDNKKIKYTMLGLYIIGVLLVLI